MDGTRPPLLLSELAGLGAGAAAAAAVFVAAGAGVGADLAFAGGAGCAAGASDDASTDASASVSISHRSAPTSILSSLKSTKWTQGRGEGEGEHRGIFETTTDVHEYVRFECSRQFSFHYKSNSTFLSNSIAHFSVQCNNYLHRTVLLSDDTGRVCLDFDCNFVSFN
jgi:hypothetical protein